MNLQLKYTVAGLGTQTVPLKNLPMIVGTLLSNQLVLRAPGVDPIHALIEDEGGNIQITDLGSAGGVFLNGKKIEVQSQLKSGDSIQIGSVVLTVEVEQAPAIPVNSVKIPPPNFIPSPMATTEKSTTNVYTTPAYTPEVASKGDPARTVRKAEPQGEDERREKKELLFSPRKARPTGDVLECVAYWDDTVLDVELFHPSFKSFEKVTIGDPTKAHLIAAGEADFSSHTLAAFGSDGFKIQLLEGMEARFRIGGAVESAQGPSKHRLGRKDIAHIKYGPVKYFLLFVRPPHIELPKARIKDPILAMLMFMAAALYLTVIPAMWMTQPKEIENPEDDVWALVQLPKKEEPPPKPAPIPKPIVKVEEVKKEPPQKRPPPPEPKPVKPVKPVEVEQPKQPKPIEKPAEKPAEKPQVADTPPQKPTPVKPEVPPAKPSPQKSNANDGGMASTGAKNPDFKKAGPPSNNPSPKSGGAVGSGMNQAGGARKGNQAVSQMGVEGPKNNQPSGVNLSKLGIGVGKILNQAGPGAINTNFKNSAGGAGGGSGSASRNYGFGGVGSSSSLGLAGSGGAVNNFGSGSGGFGGGAGGTGGLGGAGIGRGFGSGDGRGRANVSVPSTGPVVSQGLTRQEILAVIQANLNQIRHCYEQLLQRSPNASGKLTVDFTVGGSGSVTAVSISDGTISDSIMRGCVTGRVQRWEFPKPRGAASVDVKYPFVFNPL